MQKHQTCGTRQTTSWKQWQRVLISGTSHRINNDSTPLVVVMPLFTDILQLLVEQTDLYDQGHFNKQARPSCLIDITLLTIMTSLALALQMENDLRDELWDYSSKLEHFYIHWHHNMWYLLAYTANFAFCRQLKKLTKIMSMTNHGNYG